jgi:hypothetical protein
MFGGNMIHEVSPKQVQMGVSHYCITQIAFEPELFGDFLVGHG